MEKERKFCFEVAMDMAIIRVSALRQKCQNTEFFWSVLSRIWTEYGKIRTKKTPYMDTFDVVPSKVLSDQNKTLERKTY